MADSMWCQLTQGLLHPNMPQDWEDPCTSVLVQHWCTQMREPNTRTLPTPFHTHRQGIQSETGKDHMDRAMEAQANQNGEYLMPPRRGDRADLKGGNPRGHQYYHFLGPILIGVGLALLLLSISTINLC
jgi:hypothetical protein